MICLNEFHLWFMLPTNGQCSSPEGRDDVATVMPCAKLVKLKAAQLRHLLFLAGNFDMTNSRHTYALVACELNTWAYSTNSQFGHIHCEKSLFNRHMHVDSVSITRYKEDAKKFFVFQLVQVCWWENRLYLAVSEPQGILRGKCNREETHEKRPIRRDRVFRVD